jgi:toxin-antitoxin system PIN domain toxin
MIIIDANLLIYAVNRDAPLHERAKAWLEQTISGRETVALPWNVLLAFLRLTTRPGLFRHPLSIASALELIGSWLERESVTLIHPGSRHYQILRDLLMECGTGGNLTSDAHLAALAMEHGAQLYSLDGDFSRFPELDWRNPLER